MINSLILRKYSPKNMLKGEDFLEKETNSIHNALFLPVTIVSSFVYYAAHTNIENKILVYIAAIFGIIYYILTRLIFTYRLQKHLAQTIANYQFKWNLWFVDWRDEALQQAWTEKLQVLRKRGELTHQKHQKILHTYQQHSTARWAYIGLFLLICVSTFFALLLTTTKSHHKLTDFNRNRRRTLTTKVPVFAIAAYVGKPAIAVYGGKHPYK